jgi:hypothetical protein
MLDVDIIVDMLDVNMLDLDIIVHMLGVDILVDIPVDMSCVFSVCHFLQSSQF